MRMILMAGTAAILLSSVAGAEQPQGKNPPGQAVSEFVQTNPPGRERGQAISEAAKAGTLTDLNKPQCIPLGSGICGTGGSAYGPGCCPPD